MEIDITYEPLIPEREAEVVALVLSVFETHVAPGFSEQGRAAFVEYVESSAFSRRVGDGFALVALRDETVIGVIEVEGGGHVALFFVSPDCQGRGVGGVLMRKAVEKERLDNPGLDAFTVNASLGSVKAYSRIGFVVTDQEQEKDGIRFIPMVLSFNSLDEPSTD